MRKQTQTRQYGYVSPKCRTIRLEQGFCFAGSPTEVGQRNTSGLRDLVGGEGVNDDSNSWGY